MSKSSAWHMKPDTKIISRLCLHRHVFLFVFQLWLKAASRWAWAVSSGTSCRPRARRASTGAWPPTSLKSYPPLASATWSTSTWRSSWESPRADTHQSLDVTGGTLPLNTPHPPSPMAHAMLRNPKVLLAPRGLTSHLILWMSADERRGSAEPVASVFAAISLFKEKTV